MPRGVYGLDCYESWLGVPLVPWGGVPGGAGSVRVQERVAHVVPICSVKCPKSVTFGHFTLWVGAVWAACSCTCTDLALSGVLPCGAGGILGHDS